jgi:hypothetical protein
MRVFDDQGRPINLFCSTTPLPTTTPRQPSPDLAERLDTLTLSVPSLIELAPVPLDMNCFGDDQVFAAASDESDSEWQIM